MRNIFAIVQATGGSNLTQSIPVGEDTLLSARISFAIRTGPVGGESVIGAISTSGVPAGFPQYATPVPAGTWKVSDGVILHHSILTDYADYFAFTPSPVRILRGQILTMFAVATGGADVDVTFTLTMT